MDHVPKGFTYTMTTQPVSKAMQELLRRHAREIAELMAREKATRQ